MQLEAMVADLGKTCGAGAAEIIQPAPVVFGVKRKSVIFQPHVGASHLPVERCNLRSGPENVGSENDRPVAETDLRVLDGFRARLTLHGLVAAVEVPAQTRGKLLMVLKVAKAQTEGTLVPAQSCRESV